MNSNKSPAPPSHQICFTQMKPRARPTLHVHAHKGCFFFLSSLLRVFLNFLPGRLDSPGPPGERRVVEVSVRQVSPVVVGGAGGGGGSSSSAWEQRRHRQTRWNLSAVATSHRCVALCQRLHTHTHTPSHDLCLCDFWQVWSLISFTY